MPEMHSERVWITGPRGRLSGELAYGPGAPRCTALLLSPHPYMGGRMTLPLLTQLAEALAARDIITLRFDYGGIGQSEAPPVQIGESMQRFWKTGAAPEDPILLEEARAAQGWLGANAPGALALVGYSFGSFLAARLCDADTAAIAMIAPTIARHDYSTFNNPHTPTLVVYGKGDFATTDDELKAWIACLPGAAEVRKLAAGDHFFRGMEAEIAATTAEFVERACRSKEAHAR